MVGETPTFQVVSLQRTGFFFPPRRETLQGKAVEATDVSSRKSSGDKTL